MSLRCTKKPNSLLSFNYSSTFYTNICIVTISIRHRSRRHNFLSITIPTQTRRSSLESELYASVPAECASQNWVCTRLYFNRARIYVTFTRFIQSIHICTYYMLLQRFECNAWNVTQMMYYATANVMLCVFFLQELPCVCVMCSWNRSRDLFCRYNCFQLTTTLNLHQVSAQIDNRIVCGQYLCLMWRRRMFVSLVHYFGVYLSIEQFI